MENMEYAKIRDSKMSRKFIKSGFRIVCKICGGKHNLRYAVLHGYGCYICEECRLLIAALSTEL